LVPIKNKGQDGQTGVVNTALMYKHVMDKFKWGNVQDSTVYLDETNLRMTMNFRNNFARLASALAEEGKNDSAVKVLDKCLEVMPESSVPFNWFVVPVAEAYYKAGDTINANKIVTRMTNLYEQNLIYFFAFKGKMATSIKDRKEQCLAIMNRLSILATTYKQNAVAKKAKGIFEKYYEVYMQTESATDKPIKKK
jgi:hypothetical protein